MRFVLACTRRPRAFELAGFHVRRHAFAGGELAFAWQPGVFRLFEEEHGFRYVELPRPWLGEAGNASLASIRFDARSGLTVDASLDSTRTFYAHEPAPGELLCASHVALLRALGVRLEEDRERLPELFAYRQVLPPATLYRGVRAIFFASLRAVPAPGGGCEVLPLARHPMLPARGAPERSPEALARGVRESLETSLRELPDDAARYCVPLSGGVDSSVLFVLAQRRCGLRRSWSTGYPFEPEESNRERRYALSAARALGSEHTYYATDTARFLEGVIEAIATAEMPIHHHQSAMFHLMFRESVPPERDLVVLGAGADAMFGNGFQHFVHRYADHWLVRFAAATPLATAIPALARRVGRGARVARAIALHERLRLPLEDAGHPLWETARYGSLDWIARHFEDGVARALEGRRACLAPHRERSLVEQAYVLERASQGSYIWSRLIHAHGRTVHVPYKRAALHEWVMSAPADVRLASHKRILADVARELGVPAFILNRAKSGFGPRAAGWALPTGALAPLLPLAAPAVGEDELRAVQSADPALANTFWSLLNYGLWKRLCLDGERAGDLVLELRDRAARAH